MRISDWSSDVCSSDLDLEPGRGMLIGGVAVAPLAYVVEAVVIATEHVAAQGDVPVEHVRLRKAPVHRFGIAGIIDAGAQFLAIAEEIAFGDRQIDSELFKAGETIQTRNIARGLFLAISFPNPPHDGGVGLL